jgi:hypothetical protein
MRRRIHMEMNGYYINYKLMSERLVVGALILKNRLV